MNRILLLTLGLLLAAVLPAPADTPPDARAAFERLKATMPGDWTGEFTEGGKTEQSLLTFRVISGGSVLAETLDAGTPHEMLTLYHLDGDRLLVTHYCAAGNQPQLVLTGTKGDEMTFDFAGGTNLNPAKDGHMHALTLRLKGPGEVEEEWTYWEGGKSAGPTTFKLTRKK